MEPKEYKSYKLKQKLINFLIPSKSAIGLYFVISLLVLCLVNYVALKNLIFGTSLGGIQDITIYSERLSTIWDWIGNTIVWLFWGIAGLTIYAVIWFIQNSILVAEEEKEESDFVAPNLKARKSYWQSNMATNFMFFAILIIWLTYVFFSLWLLLGFLSSLFVNGLYNLPDFVAIIFVILSVLFTMLNIYGLQLVSELLTHGWRLVRPQKT